MNTDYPQLNCLVLSGSMAHHKLVSTWLGISKRVASVTAVADEAAFTKHLGHTRCHLCVVVVEHSEQALPRINQHHADRPMLVLTTTRQVTNKALCYQQSATDVVSLMDPISAQHAISRLIDECIVQQKQRYLEEHNRQLEQEIVYLHSMMLEEKCQHTLSASNDRSHRNQSKSASKLRLTQSPMIENVIESYKVNDAATGLPARRCVLERFQNMLQSEIKAPRFTALLVSIFSHRNKGAHTHADEAVQDLTLSRAASAIQQQISNGTLLGRINHHALLMVQSSYDEPVSRDAANRVRNTLGTLGGLIDAQTDIHINTLNLPAKTSIKADKLVERLEAL